MKISNLSIIAVAYPQIFHKQTNRNFIERLFRALFFQKSPSISLNSLFHNSVCLCSCVHLMASVELLEYLSVWLWLAGILVASGFDESQPVSRGESNLCLPTWYLKPGLTCSSWPCLSWQSHLPSFPSEQDILNRGLLQGTMPTKCWKVLTQLVGQR